METLKTSIKGLRPTQAYFMEVKTAQLCNTQYLEYNSKYTFHNFMILVTHYKSCLLSVNKNRCKILELFVHGVGNS